MNKVGIILFLYIIFNFQCQDSYNEFSISSSVLNQLGWKCHETIEIRENEAGTQYFNITAHSKKVTYPSVYLPWFHGDLSNFNSLKIIFNNTDISRKFYIFMWDGVGRLSYENRYNQEISYIEGSKDTMVINLKDKLITPSGRQLNIEDIKLTVFYTTNRSVPFSFPLYNIVKE